MLIYPDVEIPSHILYVEHLFSRNVDVVFFGDSAVSWSSPHDRSRVTIPQILDRMLPDKRVIDVSHASFDLRMFLDYVRYLSRTDRMPELFIIPVNIRNFSPEWYLKHSPMLAEIKNVLALKGTPAMHFMKPLLIFKAQDEEKIDFAYDNIRIVIDGRDMGRMKDFAGEDFADFSEDKLRKKLLIRFMYTFEPDNPNMAALREIVRLIKDSPAKAVFYIAPFDYQTGVKYWGEPFAERVNTNIHTVSSFLQQANMPVLDLSRALPSSYFTWSQDPAALYPNEHLWMKGRLFVAQALTKYLSE